MWISKEELNKIKYKSDLFKKRKKRTSMRVK